MSKLWIGLWITITVTVLVAVMVFLFRLKNETIELIGYSIAIAILLFVIGGLFLFGAIAKQKYRVIKAEADRKEHEAKASSYQIHKDGFGMIHLHNLTTDMIENLSIYPGSHHNGHWEEPPVTAMRAWFSAISRSREINKEVIKELPPGQLTIEQKPSLLDLIDQYPHCHIYGTTGGGKTSLLRTIAYRRQHQGHQILVLDSTAHPSTWDGLTRIRTRDKQNEAIGKLFAIYKQNEEALSTGQAVEDDFKQITVLSDEWTDIVTDNKLAQQFIREQIRKVRKFGLRLVFATQTDLAQDLGLDGAYKTTGSFLKVEIKILPDEKRIAIARVGYTLLGEYEVPIPPALPEITPTNYIAPSFDTVDVPLLTDEQKIYDMLRNGDSYRKITHAVYGQVGTYYNAKVDEVAKKMGVNKNQRV